MGMFSILISLAVARGVSAAAKEPVTADLIGYGRIELTVRSDQTGGGAAVFRCEDFQHAERLLSKLRADFTWDRLSGPRAISLPSGAPGLALDGGGIVVFARKEGRVYAACGPSAATVEAVLKQNRLDGRQARFLPEKRHPLSLDFFDLRPLSMYDLPLNVQDLEKGWKRYDRAVLARPVEFWAPYRFGCSLFMPYFGTDELADGAPQFFPLEYCVGLARAHDACVMAHVGQYWAPWWMRNRFPRDIVQWDPHAISGWGDLGAMAGTHLSQHASDAAYAYARRFTAAAIDRLESSAGDRLGCFRVVGGGHPGDEMGLHHLSTEFMDYDEAGQQAFRRWLRDARRLDLPALGRRWHDDPARYKSWDEVGIPSHFEFFGGFGTGTFDLLEGWLWRPDSPKAEAEGWHRRDYRPGDEWTPADLAPSMSQLFLFGSERDKELRQGRSTVAWFRREFDASAWLEKHRGRQVYLVAQVGDPLHLPVEVFFNEAYLGLIRPKTVSCGPIAFRATSLVKPGRNVVCLKVQSGVIRGPVFLTTQEPRRYPFLGKTQNARWIDLRDWTAQKLILGWKREARLARQRGPDIPLMFCPGGCMEFWDQFLDLKRTLGIASIHFTGGGSSYQPWWAGLGYVLGATMTSEEGGTINDPAALSRELAWILLNGQGHHNYYYSAVDYMRLEHQTGWFSKNSRLFELVGKATWQKPPVAVLRAARSDLYFPYNVSVRAWDVGAGPLQAAHYQNVYVTEAEIKAGLAAAYPVVFDAGTSVLDDELLAAIERYVRAGGTFVAQCVTGRHSLLEADAWPIARLTGFKVLRERDRGRLTMVRPNPLFARLAGHSFDGDGIALDCKDAGGPADAEPADGAAAVLARWEDGASAGAMRKLGRGRIVLLGSPFWQSTSDRTADGVVLDNTVETTFFHDLFSALAVHRQADVDSEDVWVRRFTTKNGLQQWVMAYHAGRAPLKGLTLSFPVAKRPSRVADVVSGKPVEFAWQEGMVRVARLDLEPNAIRVFAVDNADPLEAVRHWFAEKRHFEARPAAFQPVEPLPTPPPTALVMDRFRFRQLAAAPPDLAWLSEPTDGAGWQDASYGFWDEMGMTARGIGLYRRAFRVPQAWRGRRVLLAFVSFDYPVFLEHAEVYVNGKRAGEYRGHGWANFDVLDVTPHLQAGENALAILVAAKEGRGGYLGQLVAYCLESLEDPIELVQGWRLFRDNRQHAPAALPLDAPGRHLETDVPLPAAWQGKHVFLEFEVADRWVGCIVVNGRVIAYNQFLHPYAGIMQVNLYPWVRPGQTNRIELWPRTPEETARCRMVVKRVRMGAVSQPADGKPQPLASP